MPTEVVQMISSIRAKASKMLADGFGCDLGPDAWVFSHLESDLSSPVDLTFFAVIHGDEVGGLGVLDHLLDELTVNKRYSRIRVAMALGNVRAATLAGGSQRYIEADMNRGFGRKTWDCDEHKRALFLQSILDRSRYLVDLHQTVRPCPDPFFIFPYASGAIRLASNMDASLPIVTHWGVPFSTEGMCTDTYVNARGGIGLTLELGQIGFHKNVIQIGVAACLRALDWVIDSPSGKEPVGEVDQPCLYTWAQVLPYHEGDCMLPHSDNFLFVRRGQVLGEGHSGEIKSPCDGWLLFAYEPKIWHKKQPNELCRIMKRIRVEDLP